MRDELLWRSAPEVGSFAEPAGEISSRERTGSPSPEEIQRRKANTTDSYQDAMEQAVLVRAHVASMRAKLESSLLHLAEAQKALEERDQPQPVN